MRMLFRPLDRWRDPETRGREHARFKASYQSTLDLLEREVDHVRKLNAHEVVIEVVAAESAARLDGGLRVNASVYHPGVVVSFESKHGPLRYATDRFPHWHDNLRAIALGLEALRKVDRYGIATSGEQYRGWSALPPGQPIAVGAAMTIDEARRVLAFSAVEELHVESIEWQFRRMAKEHHPDVGGDPEMFRRITAARDVLLGGAR